MGAIIGRFRKKPDTIEVLENINKKISELQKNRSRTTQLQNQYIGSLILYSIIFYIVGALVFFFYYFPRTWPRRFVYSAPLLIFPLLIWLIKKLLHWYFIKRIAKNDMKLSDLRGEKKQILEDVMEKETYKKAKEILEKFDPERFKKLEPQESTPRLPQPTPGSNLRQRVLPGRGAAVSPSLRPRFPSPQMTPGPRPYPGSSPAFSPRMTPTQHNGTPARYPPGPPLPRPVLPRQRGKVDKLLDYLVGDGPQHRYALICHQCLSHNGMAVPEEFEYLSFRCCYCFTLNKARKQRPNAPRLEVLVPQSPAPSIPSVPGTPEVTDDDNSDGETSMSIDDTETETKSETKSIQPSSNTLSSVSLDSKQSTLQGDISEISDAGLDT